MRDYLVARGVPADRIAVDDRRQHARDRAAHARLSAGASRVARGDRQPVLPPRAGALAFERVGIARADISAAYPRRFQLRDVYSSWREVPAYAVYAARLWVNPDARPVSFRPMLYLMSLFS